MFTTGSAQYASRPNLVCCICAEPVALEISKTDERGKAVHEECYVRKIRRFKLDEPLRLPEDWLSAIGAKFYFMIPVN
jgi:hypothetical protein